MKKILFAYFSLLCCFQLQTFGQVRDLSVGFGLRFPRIRQLNDWDLPTHRLNLKPINQAWTSELSFDYYPLQTKNLFIQATFGYSKVESQNISVESVGENDEIRYFDYGFDLDYYVFPLSPGYVFELPRKFSIKLYAGLHVIMTLSSQNGIKIRFNPYAEVITYDLQEVQYNGRYHSTGISWRAGGSLTKSISNRISLFVSAGYDRIPIKIGEKSTNIPGPGFPIIIVPIPHQTLNLSGFNMTAGLTFKMNK